MTYYPINAKLNLRCRDNYFIQLTGILKVSARYMSVAATLDKPALDLTESSPSPWNSALITLATLSNNITPILFRIIVSSKFSKLKTFKLNRENIFQLLVEGVVIVCTIP